MFFTYEYTYKYFWMVNKYDNFSVISFWVNMNTNEYSEYSFVRTTTLQDALAS